MKPPLIIRRRGASLLLVMLMAPASVRANVGPPSSGGHVVAEPIGIIDVAITRETLSIDLRPLAANGLAVVEAVYHLHNSGPEKKLDLLFASGSASIADFQVWLGSERLVSASAAATALPESWQAPGTTPGLGDESELAYLRYSRRGVTPLAFAVTIPPGLHDLKVRYAAEAATYHGGHATVYRQFAYVLAPARAWSGFGGLDLAIHLPRNWRAACTPSLQRDGDTFTGSFDSLPADSIALTVQAPEGWAYRPVACASLGLLALAALGGALMCRRGGRSNGRRLAIAAENDGHFFTRHAWPRSCGLGVAWSLSILATGLLATLVPDWILPSGQASHYGYGQAVAMLGVFALSIIAMPGGFLLAQLTAVAVCRREMASSADRESIRLKSSN